MKRFLIVIILFISACHKIDSRQKQADALINAYVSSNHINGQNKYEAITFSKLIGLRDTYINTKDGINLNREIMLGNDSIRNLDKQQETLMKETKVPRKELETVAAKEDIIFKRQVANANKMIRLSRIKGPLQGYKLYYTYKVENNFRDPIYHKMTFKIDTSILKIISVKDTIIDANDIKW